MNRERCMLCTDYKSGNNKMYKWEDDKNMYFFIFIFEKYKFITMMLVYTLVYERNQQLSLRSMLKYFQRLEHLTHI